MDEHDFRKKCDEALLSLRQRLLAAGDEHGFEVEGQGEKLEVLFEEPEEVRFVISPNTPVQANLDFRVVDELQIGLVGVGGGVRTGKNR